MKKENQNIHTQMISEDNKVNKNKQTNSEISGKAMQLSGLQNDVTVVEELDKIQPSFALINSECLKPDDEPDRVDIQDSHKSTNSPDVSELFASFQKVKTEEQRLLEIKQQILAQRYGLQNKLVGEIEKKKTRISKLVSEIHDLQNINKQLEQALGVDIYDQTQVLKINSTTLTNAGVQEDLPECAGLLTCSKPEKCRDYESCLNKYLNAEMRNDDLKL